MPRWFIYRSLSFDEIHLWFNHSFNQHKHLESLNMSERERERDEQYIQLSHTLSIMYSMYFNMLAYIWMIRFSSFSQSNHHVWVFDSKFQCWWYFFYFILLGLISLLKCAEILLFHTQFCLLGITQCEVNFIFRLSWLVYQFYSSVFYILNTFEIVRSISESVISNVLNNISSLLYDANENMILGLS